MIVADTSGLFAAMDPLRFTMTPVEGWSKEPVSF